MGLAKNCANVFSPVETLMTYIQLKWLSITRNFQKIRLPLMFLVSYLSLILFFAGLYRYVVPDQLYAPYARLEYGAHADSRLAELALAAAIGGELKGENIFGFQESLYHIDPKSIQVADIESTDGKEVTFLVSFRSYSDTANKQGVMQESVPIRIQARPIATSYSDPLHPIAYRIPDINLPPQRGDERGFHMTVFNAIFNPPRHEGDGILYESPRLALDSREEKLLDNYVAGVKGDPSAVTGQFPRMLYFSAEVITTLGLGDIVPLTNTSRFFVGLEAVLGIVFAGLFINAVALRGTGRSQQGP